MGDFAGRRLQGLVVWVGSALVAFPTGVAHADEPTVTTSPKPPVVTDVVARSQAGHDTPPSATSAAPSAAALVQAAPSPAPCPAAMKVWIDGRLGSLDDPTCKYPVADSRPPCAEPLGIPRSVTVEGGLPAGHGGENVRVDVQVPGYAVAHAFVPVEGAVGRLHATMQRLDNLRLKVRGDKAAATGYAIVTIAGHEQQVDRCRVDIDAGVPYCDMYVPTLPDGTFPEVRLQVVGTLNATIDIGPKMGTAPGSVTEFEVHAPRKRFDPAAIVGIAATVGVGTAAGAAMAGAGGEPNNMVGWEVAGVVLTSAALGAAFYWIWHVSEREAEFETRSVQPDGTEILPGAPVSHVPAFIGRSPDVSSPWRTTTASASPGFVLRW